MSKKISKEEAVELFKRATVVGIKVRVVTTLYTENNGVLQKRESIRDKEDRPVGYEWVDVTEPVEGIVDRMSYAQIATTKMLLDHREYEKSLSENIEDSEDFKLYLRVQKKFGKKAV